MRDPLDISGKWDGLFKYPQSYAPTTPFLAEITESGGAFSGLTIEPDLYGGSAAQAKITGVRSGRSVDFTKTYMGRLEGYENPVDYVGQLSEDGQRITGVWSLRDWNGEFEMTREASMEQAAQTAEEVEV